MEFFLVVKIHLIVIISFSCCSHSMVHFPKLAFSKNDKKQTNEEKRILIIFSLEKKMLNFYVIILVLMEYDQKKKKPSYLL